MSWWARFRAEWVRLAQGPLEGGLLLVLIFWMTAAASFSGSLGKWGLRDNEVGLDIQSLVDRRADRPLIYRRLVPDLVNAADRVVPVSVQKVFVGQWRPDDVFVRTSAFANPGLSFRYALICHIMLLALFASLFLLRRIAIDAGADRLSATLAPIGLVLAFPYLQTRGGYFYDQTELLFLAAAFRLAQTGQWPWLIALALPATLNKETFFCLLPALYPLLAARMPRGKAAAAILAALAIGAAVNVWDRCAFTQAHIYTVNETARWTAYFQLRTYATLELTYGMRGPSSLFLGTCLATLVLVLRGWPFCERPIRQHLAIMTVINLPLVFAAGTVGELRNLSFLFVGLTILGALGFDRSLHAAEGAAFAQFG